MRTVQDTSRDLAICVRLTYQTLLYAHGNIFNSSLALITKTFHQLFDARHALLLFIFLEFQIFGLQTKSSQPCLFNWLFRAMSKYK